MRKLTIRVATAAATLVAALATLVAPTASAAGLRSAIMTLRTQGGRHLYTLGSQVPAKFLVRVLEVSQDCGVFGEGTANTSQWTDLGGTLSY